MVVAVTVDDFIRAESDRYFGVLVAEGAWQELRHDREPASIDHQTVIRLNRDTLYSSIVVDLDAGPVTITMPDAGTRFMSLIAIDQDHHARVVYGPGAYTYTRERIGTRYALFGIRTLVDPDSPEDLAVVHALQDQIGVTQTDRGTFEVPDWDQVGLTKIRDALMVLGSTLPDLRSMFGTKDQVDPVRHLIGTAMAWGGNPDKDAVYLNVTPERNDGATVYRLTVGDVPVDGFWSISVYNAAGYYEPNPAGVYGLNNLTAKPDDDGAITVQFGGCDGTIPNCLPTMPGWNYMVRLYRPRFEIVDGSWTFPMARAVA
jgi:hypothetical protein